MIKPRVLGFDWKESPHTVVNEIKKAIKGIAHPIIQEVDMHNDQVVLIISDKKLGKKEQRKLLGLEA